MGGGALELMLECDLNLLVSISVEMIRALGSLVMLSESVGIGGLDLMHYIYELGSERGGGLDI